MCWTFLRPAPRTSPPGTAAPTPPFPCPAGKRHVASAARGTGDGPCPSQTTCTGLHHGCTARLDTCGCSPRCLARLPPIWRGVAASQPNHTQRCASARQLMALRCMIASSATREAGVVPADGGRGRYLHRRAWASGVACTGAGGGTAQRQAGEGRAEDQGHSPRGGGHRRRRWRRRVAGTPPPGTRTSRVRTADLTPAPTRERTR